MTGPVDPMGAIERRQTRRRSGDAAASTTDGGSNVPAVIEGERPEVHAGSPRPDGFTPFAAHVYGQTGQKRGLRGGQPVIDKARAAYLETEFSGPDDRRPPKGLLKKTEI
jgi:hypothetical protein